ncbi:G-protein alpha subunit-domain-containing protein [Chiua virens]|nr:G-protein alpha subunit-domain-containing protein [Chiua virens]
MSKRTGHTYSSSEPILLQSVGGTSKASRYYDPDAARISQKIDEELRRDWARIKDAERKQVKVMLLGQAESGKSTLQKQFQLYYAHQALEHARPLWRPVVYFNIIKAVRMILDELDHELANIASDDSTEGQAVAHALAPLGDVSADVSQLRSKLVALISIEDSLASELSGGVSVTGGRTGVRAVPATGGPSPGVAHVTNLAARTLNSTQDEVDELWKHPAVRILVDNRRIRLDESASFFLDSVKRVAQPDYLPSTADLLNRHAWVPYFDDATAIIFLAPISAFDQYLEEDARTNRVDDSLQLFTAICSNKLLKNSHLVLLLNKTDLLKKKLEAGIKVRKYITSYGDRPNTFADVSEYFRAHFIQVHRRNDIGRRALYAHFTSMLDIRATQAIIVNVGEAIIRSHIARTGLA